MVIHIYNAVVSNHGIIKSGQASEVTWGWMYLAGTNHSFARRSGRDHIISAMIPELPQLMEVIRRFFMSRSYYEYTYALSVV